MDFGRTRLRHVKFPGRAGEFQREGRTAALIRELGDNYRTYHDFLAGELDTQRPRPRRDQFADREAYVAAWAYIQELVIAEVMLRSFRAYRRDGRRLDEPAELTRPIVQDDRLVAEE